jgi:hypothetical protein
MKEAIHVTRDIGRFREAAAHLIELDPTWSVSHAETAAGLEAFGLVEEARQTYADAVDWGVPYVWRHAFELFRLSASLSDWAGADQALTQLIRDDAPRPVLEKAVGQLSADGSMRFPDEVRARLRRRLSQRPEGWLRRVDPHSRRSA